ncbi:cobalt ECF transporter T component CbiQ [Lentilactobacillus kisonensis]|uniref:Cobalt ABC transporter, permease protein CbiQ n=2 Tax=Lentilactobacillus kisonensis TaxID=481722 RepID=H1LK40_9LACO|nr:cobalt ECF transporter T component CbiQ [Lentilactobacillus kisonensis]EHO47980.1 cobalt ABC transporter, permease protein CbiQ [Lentilactobacillus kisonensis F0435]KRL21625.1 cobalt ABC transporter, permease protein CbiQ [Lentilactobacillus kisonensis DSM 19906 = JCM 15041]
MLVIDKYAYTNRIVAWSPKTKGIVWLLCMVIAFQPIVWLKGILIVAVAVDTIYVTKVSVRRYLRWFYVILPFLLLSVIGIVFTMTPIKDQLYLPIHLFGNYFGVSKAMLPKGLLLAVQVLAAVVSTYWFALTTPFRQILDLLVSLHLSNLIIEETMLMYRFIFIFIDSFEEIHRAQKLRFGYRNVRTSLHSLSILVKMLFEQIMINYEAMTHALDAKLYDGEFTIGKSRMEK